MIMAEVFYFPHVFSFYVGGWRCVEKQEVRASVLVEEVTGQFTGICSLLAMCVSRGSLRSSALVASPS